jgi:endonuclease/exonuclease/phosphatase family metal-dependent hydrolase
MKIRILVVCLFVAALFALLFPGQARSETLCVMTFNLRFASAQPPNSWPERRPVMRDCIREVAPDLIGTQEGLYAQLRDIAADLPEYDWIGLGRAGGSRDEFMAVYYLKDRFEPLAFDHFWLSDAPELIGSRSWGNQNRRMVTWVKFLDRKTDQQFYFFNTHLDHQVQESRLKSTELILQRIDALETSLPVLLVGDFNANPATNPIYGMLTDDGGFVDTWDTAAERRGELFSTFHGYRAPVKDGVRIDWILARGDVITDATKIVTYEQNGQYPSDHFPVVAWLRFGKPDGE